MPQTVTCRFCREQIVLNEDSEETRELNCDPHQQLRRHLIRHLSECVQVARKCGWLIDMLCFAPSDPERWKRTMHETLDWLIEEFQRESQEIPA